jgi:hypothetical protein
LPDDHSRSSHVSLRVPNHLIEAFDKLAAKFEGLFLYTVEPLPEPLDI